MGTRFVPENMVWDEIYSAYTEETSTVYTEEISVVHTEEISSMYAVEISSVYTEQISLVYAEESQRWVGSSVEAYFKILTHISLHCFGLPFLLPFLIHRLYIVFLYPFIPLPFDLFI